MIDPLGSPEEVWRNSYDSDLPHSGYNVRQQSSDPMVTTYALRMFAKVLLKRRKRIKPRLSRSDRLNTRCSSPEKARKLPTELSTASRAMKSLRKLRTPSRWLSKPTVRNWVFLFGKLTSLELVIPFELLNLVPRIPHQQCYFHHLPSQVAVTNIRKQLYFSAPFAMVCRLW